MKEVVLTHASSDFKWIDISDPSPQDLEKLAQHYHLHATSVKDCLEPYHLPKYERFEKQRFVMLRIMDESAPADASTILELTRKIALFVCPHLLITIHRKESALLKGLQEKWSERLKSYPNNPSDHLALDILSEGFGTFDHELDHLEAHHEQVELAVFEIRKQPYDLHSVYILKRRAAVCRRLLRLTNEVLSRFAVDTDPANQVYVKDLKENVENSLFYAEDLMEGLNQLVTTHHSVEAQKANDVMKFLAVFSAFFLPLTLIAGVYGMNFKNMPEIDAVWGYPACLGLMAVTALSIWFWFKKKRWL